MARHSESEVPHDTSCKLHSDKGTTKPAVECVNAAGTRRPGCTTRVLLAQRAPSRTAEEDHDEKAGPSARSLTTRGRSSTSTRIWLDQEPNASSVRPNTMVSLQ
jgi:hypothetical protein